jgi:ribosomal protein S18 acetylase RimI-like enzyme
MHTGNTTVVLRPMGWRELAPVFNLTLQGSADGHFTPLYRQPRYMAGLGLQLFSLLAGRLRLPDGLWHRANASVLQVYGSFAGFVVLRQQPDEAEIYLCALLPQFRGQGLGRCMLKLALAKHLAPGQRVSADCLPASQAMKGLLQSLGFDAVKPRPRPRPRPAAVRYAMVWPAPALPASA